MLIDVSASPEGASAPGDSEAGGPDGPVLGVTDPEIDGLGVAGGDVEVHAANTRSTAISGAADARADPIRATLSSPDEMPGDGRERQHDVLRARQPFFFGGGVSGGTVRPCAESSINVARRRSRVSSFFALITQ